MASPDRVRPAEHNVYCGPVVIVSGQVCAYLNKLCLDKIRSEVRGQNPQLDAELTAIRIAGLRFLESSSAGTVPAPPEERVPQSQPQLENTLSTTEAATLLHLTRRAISQECKQKRLPATLIGGRYRITRDDLHHFRDTR